MGKTAPEVMLTTAPVCSARTGPAGLGPNLAHRTPETHRRQCAPRAVTPKRASPAGRCRSTASWGQHEIVLDGACAFTGLSSRADAQGSMGSAVG